MPINRDLVKNIVVVRDDRFGEFLLNIPAFRALESTFPNAKVIALVNPSVEELAESLGYFEEIITWGPGKHSIKDKLGLIRQLKSIKPDIVLMLNPSKEMNILTFLAGIPVRVGYDRKLGLLLTHKIKDLKHLGQRHEVEYNLELVSLVGAKTEDTSLSLKVDSGTIDTVSKELGLDDPVASYIAMHPWSSDEIKKWSVGNFQELSRRILSGLKVKLVLVGAGEHLAESKSIFGEMGDNFINLTGKTSLVQLAAVLKKCRLLITGDSGPMHLACAVGTPVVAIFRNDIPGKSPKRWGPWGSGNIIIQKSNLYEITVDAVLDGVGTVLKTKLNCP